MLQNRVDNDWGTLDYAAGILVGELSAGTFELAVVRLKAIADTSSTALAFAFTPSRKTDVVYAGSSVLAEHTDANILIVAPVYESHLPPIVKSYSP